MVLRLLGLAKVGQDYEVPIGVRHGRHRRFLRYLHLWCRSEFLPLFLGAFAMLLICFCLKTYGAVEDIKIGYAANGGTKPWSCELLWSFWMVSMILTSFFA